MALDEIEARYMTPEEFTKFLAGEVARWAPLAKQIQAAEAAKAKEGAKPK